jgi:hypothetical protein
MSQSFLWTSAIFSVDCLHLMAIFVSGIHWLLTVPAGLKGAFWERTYSALLLAYSPTSLLETWGSSARSYCSIRFLSWISPGSSHAPCLEFTTHQMQESNSAWSSDLATAWRAWEIPSRQMLSQGRLGLLQCYCGWCLWLRLLFFIRPWMRCRSSNDQLDWCLCPNWSPHVSC